MKTCIDCNTLKPFEAYVPKKSCADGYEPRCRVCRSNKYNKSSVELVAKKLWNSQVASSKKRGMSMPGYTKEELLAWLLTQPIFMTMYEEWKQSDYDRNLAPSVDRISDLDSYKLSTIQLMTWDENRKKAGLSKKNSELLVHHRSVIALNKDGTVFKQYASMAEAMREFGGKPSASFGISSVCNGVPIKDGKGRMYTPKTYKGYMWEWA